LELIELDAALLAPGSLYYERLQVYRAHCYRQFGQLETARGLYHEAHQAAKLRGFGQSYPVRALLWCAVLDLASGANSGAQLAEIDAYLGELRALGEAHSLGHGLLGAAWAKQCCGDTARAAQLLDEATEVFEHARFESEAAWCRGDELAPSSDKRLSFPDASWRASACFYWLSEVPILAPQERWRAARAHFQARDVVAATEWMGLFF